MLYHGEVFLDSRGFTVKLARYTVEARVFMEEKEALVSAVIFVCNAARLDGIRRMKNARCVTLPFLDFCLAGNRRRRDDLCDEIGKKGRVFQFVFEQRKDIGRVL